MANKNRIYSKSAKAKGSAKVVRAAALIMVLLIVCTVFAGCDSGGSGTTNAYYGEPVTEYAASSADLYCLEFTRYNGAFVEDGQNEQVENVAAVLIENRAQWYLDYAKVTYYVGDKIATFNVTGLPAGEKAWVLEAEKMQIVGEPNFVFLDCESTFRKDAVLSTKLLSVETEDNVLTVTNKANKPLQNVCVYYKNVNSDGNYLGGITYMISFDTLNAGESAQKYSAHFSENSQIVRYSFQE